MKEFWVFGYGSLMWRPGFPHDAAIPARLEGAHRALCIYSVNHRGSRIYPGLVLGLDHSGRCDGMAFRVPAAFAHQTNAYLRAREQVTKVYSHALRRVALQDGSGRSVMALAFLVNRRHRQYAGALPPGLQAEIVRKARGKSGRNIDYVTSTVSHLRLLGVHDAKLERLMVLLGKHRQLNPLAKNDLPRCDG